MSKKEKRDKPRLVTITVQDENGPRQMQTTREKLNEVSMKQGRITLSGAQVEAILQLNGARWLLGDCIKKLKVSPVRRIKLWFKLRTAQGMLKSFSDEFMADYLNLEQVLVIDRALTGMGIHITSAGDPVPEHCLCMDHEAITYIAAVAAAQCAFECKYKTSKASKNCRLRRSFNAIPGLQETAASGAEIMPEFPGLCPYYLLLHPEVMDHGDD